jgi:16S rRNA U516 pseudouridylate synthase RsuA-like enzyme
LRASIENAHDLGTTRLVERAAIRVKFTMSKQTLDRILQSQGFGTRKYCRALIADGHVIANGELQDNYKAQVETDGLVLEVFDERWVYRERVYLALYKPANYECSRKPSHHPRRAGTAARTVHLARRAAGGPPRP